MTAEELYSIVSRWPEKYRSPYVSIRPVNGWWYASGPAGGDEMVAVATEVAAMLLCYYAEGVLMKDGVLWKWIDNDSTVGAECMGTAPNARHYHESSKAPTRLAAIDALIGKVEGIGTN